MSGIAIILSPRQNGMTGPDLEEKYRRVVNRHDRLNLLVDMQAPAIAVRNERQMLKLAVDELFDDADVQEIVSGIGVRGFTNYLNYIAGIEIESPVVNGAGVSPRV